MTAKRKESLAAELEKVMEERCDCVISIRAATICWRCRKLDMIAREMEDL